VLHAKDRGCTAPGCDAPGYRCEVHHVDEWATGGPTNVDTLTFTCPDNHHPERLLPSSDDNETEHNQDEVA